MFLYSFQITLGYHSNPSFSCTLLFILSFIVIFYRFTSSYGFQNIIQKFVNISIFINLSISILLYLYLAHHRSIKIQIQIIIHQPQYNQKEMSERRRKLSMPRESSRKNNSFLNKKDQQFNFNDGEHDAKTYRMIMQKFLSELNYLGKKYKDCLGQLDQNYKIILTKEQKYFQQENMTMIFERNVDKMKKQMIYRNTQIQKSINQYADEYTDEFGQCGKENQQKVEDPHLTESQNQIFNNDLTYTNRRYRPNSSVGFRAKSNNVQSQRGKYRWEMKAIKNSISQSTNMDDPEVFDTEANQCLILKREIHKKSSFVTRQNLIYGTNERKQTKGLDSTTLNKFFNKNTIHQRKQQMKKSIDQVSRQKVQNKLIMINTSLAINLIQSQGYKPKAKCWRPTFQNQKQNLL